MGLKHSYDYGATPLSPDEAEGLKPKHISTHKELNEWEAVNISEAVKWVFKRKQPHILSVDFILKLHKRMFSDTWSWAGSFRLSEKNVGVSPFQIQVKLQALIEDTNFWIEQETFDFVEIAVRLHHRLTFIHPFPNGNGRHARLYTDVFNNFYDKEPFTWGSHLNIPVEDVRKMYINALRKADQKDYSPLLKILK
jgi:Fic-DOC domain mobile mystery protein B